MDKFIIINVHDATLRKPQNNPNFFLVYEKKKHVKKNGLKFKILSL